MQMYAISKLVRHIQVAAVKSEQLSATLRSWRKAIRDDSINAHKILQLFKLLQHSELNQPYRSLTFDCSGCMGWGRGGGGGKGGGQKGKGFGWGGTGGKRTTSLREDEMTGSMHTWAFEDVGGTLAAAGERADAGGPVTSACGAPLA